MSKSALRGKALMIKTILSVQKSNIFQTHLDFKNYSVNQENFLLQTVPILEKLCKMEFVNALMAKVCKMVLVKQLKVNLMNLIIAMISIKRKND